MPTHFFNSAPIILWDGCDFNAKKNQINSHWFELQNIFQQSDQCLELGDPIGVLLDSFERGKEEAFPLFEYFIRRISSDISDDCLSYDTIIRNSLGAYFAKKNGNSDWIKSKIAMVKEKLDLMPTTDNENRWISKLSVSCGISTNTIESIGNALSQILSPKKYSMLEWVEFLWVIFLKSLGFDYAFLSPSELEDVFGKEYSGLISEEEKAHYVVNLLRPALNDWMAGECINKIEISLGTSQGKINKCKRARKFILRTIPSLAYFANVVSQIYWETYSGKEATDQIMPISLEYLPIGIKNGLDTVEKIALSKLMAIKSPRKVIHNEYLKLALNLKTRPVDESFEKLMGRIKQAYLSS
jgi:hypothetical protein